MAKTSLRPKNSSKMPKTERVRVMVIVNVNRICCLSFSLLVGVIYSPERTEMANGGDIVSPA